MTGGEIGIVVVTGTWTEETGPDHPKGSLGDQIAIMRRRIGQIETGGREVNGRIM